MKSTTLDTKLIEEVCSSYHNHDAFNLVHNFCRVLQRTFSFDIETHGKYLIFLSPEYSKLNSQCVHFKFEDSKSVIVVYSKNDSSYQSEHIDLENLDQNLNNKKWIKNIIDTLNPIKNDSSKTH